MNIKINDVFEAIDTNNKIYRLRCINKINALSGIEYRCMDIDNPHMIDDDGEFGYIAYNKKYVTVWNIVADKWGLPKELNIIENNSNKNVKFIKLLIPESKYEELLEIFSEETDIEVIE